MERIEIRRAFSEVTFFSSGSTMLDCALGGGWACNRIFNIVGDKSSGKTLQAIEAFANFTRTFPKGRMRYAEAEAAFNDSYAETLGFPGTVEKPTEQITTVEEFYKDLMAFVEPESKSKDTTVEPCLYILDSLDALSDSAEMDEELDKAGYGAAKAKMMSKIFRKGNTTLSANNCTLGIISQLRDNIGVTWGEGSTRSGGRALDFYASQVAWLQEVGKLKRTVKGVELPYGVDVKARVKKNKVGMPFREAWYQVVFGYGVDDEISMLNWLLEIKAFSKEDGVAEKKAIDKARSEGNRGELTKIGSLLKSRVASEWAMMEAALAPKVRKYV